MERDYETTETCKWKISEPALRGLGGVEGCGACEGTRDAAVTSDCTECLFKADGKYVGYETLVREAVLV